MLAGSRIQQAIVPALGDWLKPSEVVARLDGLSATGLIVAWAIAPTHPARTQIARYVTEWQAVRHVLRGEDLSALGIKPGPIYGRLLKRLRTAWLDGEVSSVEEERALAARLVAGGWGDDDGDARE